MPDTTPLTPSTPHAAISAFSYLRAVQADDTGEARAFAGAEPRMPDLLIDVAEQLVVATQSPVRSATRPSITIGDRQRPGLETANVTRTA
ncbi:hypothetical protein [Streptomyces flaveolus]|uniref:hypothetical protein n=1 Tax=Streptomyces flaveolus TaxID=67297 RepID=UPI0033EEFF28